MTPDEIRAILARAEAATEGPWSITPNSSGEEARYVFAPNGIVLDGQEHVSIIAHSLSRTAVQQPRDAAFIAASRTDVPALCRELLRYKAFVAWFQGIEAPGHVDGLWREFEKTETGE